MPIVIYADLRYNRDRKKKKKKKDGLKTMKEIYSVEIKQNDYNDDLFNGTLAECIDYIQEYGYTALDNDVRIAKIMLDSDSTVTECLEIISPDDL